MILLVVAWPAFLLVFLVIFFDFLGSGSDSLLVMDHPNMEAIRFRMFLNEINTFWKNVPVCQISRSAISLEILWLVWDDFVFGGKVY